MAGLKTYKAFFLKSPSSIRSKEERLRSDKDEKDWPVNDWRKVFVSDVSSFQLFPSPILGRQRPG